MKTVAPLFSETDSLPRLPTEIQHTISEEVNTSSLPKLNYRRSFKTKLFSSFKPIIPLAYLKKLEAKDMDRTWIDEETHRLRKIESFCIKQLSEQSTLQRRSDPFLPSAEDIRFKKNRRIHFFKMAKKSCKKKPLEPITQTRNHVYFAPYPKGTGYFAVFKELDQSHAQAELSSYYTSLLIGLPFFNNVEFNRLTVRHNLKPTKITGVFSSFLEHQKCSDFLGEKGALDALQRLPVKTVQSLALMHLVLGSQDAHFGNTLVQFLKGANHSIKINSIVEIDGESSMPTHHRYNEEYRNHGDIAAMRIWWLGLPQCDQNLDEELQDLILSWDADKICSIHQELGFYGEDKLVALAKRIDLIRERVLAFKNQEFLYLSPRHLFSELVEGHSTLNLIKLVYTSDLQRYNLIGHASKEQLEEALKQKKRPRDKLPLGLSQDLLSVA